MFKALRLKNKLKEKKNKENHFPLGQTEGLSKNLLGHLQIPLLKGFEPQCGSLSGKDQGGGNAKGGLAQGGHIEE